MAKNFIIEQLKKKFKERESFSREELFDFYRQIEPSLNENTFRWRIYNLKTKKIITSISQELFTLSYKPIFKPEIAETERKIYTKIEKKFPDLKQCIWSTKFVNEFMLHIPSRFITVLQVEKDALEPIYEFLKEQNFRNVFIQPEEKEIERYIYETESAIILQSLISKSPTQIVKKITTTTIEKMIVDLYCEKKLFNVFQGSELIHIINNVYNRYSINFTKLFAYAKRRRKENNIMEFLSYKTDIPNSLFND
ncbi:MAG: hypothetical protein HGB12_10215 [Bacteroidetes bacterium]|nr:hypothetical protein [Bacteroidota bacterium]